MIPAHLNASPHPQLPTLTLPPFTGSCRIQPLSTVPTRWFKVVDVPLDQQQAAAVVVLESLSAIPRVTLELPLRELTLPYRWIHAALDVQSPAFQASFRVRAALALRDSELPIRVVVDEDGRPSRPQSLLKLCGLAPGGEAEALRISMDWSAENWRRHVDKHLMNEEELELWQPSLQKLRLPVRAHHLKSWVRLAQRAEDGPEELQGLKPEQWPLVEVYAAATMAVFGDLLGGRALHLGRLLEAPGAVLRPIDALLRLVGDEFGVDPGAEQLLAVTDTGLLAVGRHNRGPAHALRWRSTYQQPKAGQDADKVARLAKSAGRHAGFDVVVWPQELVRT